MLADIVAIRGACPEEEAEMGCWDTREFRNTIRLGARLTDHRVPIFAVFLNACLYLLAEVSDYWGPRTETHCRKSGSRSPRDACVKLAKIKRKERHANNCVPNAKCRMIIVIYLINLHEVEEI